eukprot:gene8363-9823_t
MARITGQNHHVAEAIKGHMGFSEGHGSLKKLYFFKTNIEGQWSEDAQFLRFLRNTGAITDIFTDIHPLDRDCGIQLDKVHLPILQSTKLLHLNLCITDISPKENIVVPVGLTKLTLSILCSGVLSNLVKTLKYHQSLVELTLYLGTEDTVQYDMDIGEFFMVNRSVKEFTIGSSPA